MNEFRNFSFSIKMNIEIKLNLGIFLILSCYLCSWQVKALDRRGYRTNLQTVRKASYSYPKIIFLDDDDEPLVPIPTFPTPKKSSAIEDSIIIRSRNEPELRNPTTKRPTTTSQSSISKIRMGNKNETGRTKPVNPAPVTKQPTTAITVDTKKRIIPGSVNQSAMKRNQKQKDLTDLIPDNFEEPILQGSYYVPFKKMRNITR